MNSLDWLSCALMRLAMEGFRGRKKYRFSSQGNISQKSSGVYSHKAQVLVPPLCQLEPGASHLNVSGSEFSSIESDKIGPDNFQCIIL